MIDPRLMVNPTPESRTRYSNQRVTVLHLGYQRPARVPQTGILVAVLMTSANHLSKQLHIYVLALVPADALLCTDKWDAGTPQDVRSRVAHIGVRLSPSRYYSTPGRQIQTISRQANGKNMAPGENKLMGNLSTE